MRFVSTAGALLLHLSVGNFLNHFNIFLKNVLNHLHVLKFFFGVWMCVYIIGKVYLVDIYHSARTFYGRICVQTERVIVGAANRSS